STGEPKGAGVFHLGFANLLQWYASTLQLTGADRTLLVSAVGFDLTQKNLFAPLLVGASLRMPVEVEEGFNPQSIAATIASDGITFINCTPSSFYPLLDDHDPAQLRRLASLRWVVLGGEPIQIEPLRYWLNAPDCHARILNTYGPTECTDICAAWAFDAGASEALIPIGRPIDNVLLSVLDEQARPVMPGQVGELWIGGAGLGAGYLNQPELNVACFVTIDALSRTQPMYRSGDRVRWRKDGVLEFLGRGDTQIKFHGFRVELGEVEAALRRLPHIDDSVVIIHGEGAQQKLVAYVVADVAIQSDQLSAALG